MANDEAIPPQPTPDPRFGAVEAFWVPEEAAELNLGWERIIFYWREIQPTGRDDWNTLHVREEWLREATAQGRQVMGLLKNTPPWATDEDASEASLPRGLYLPIDDPDNLWANYVRRVADYYAPLGVHHWVIWNEPDISKGVYGFEFNGTVEDYVQMLKIAAVVMKEIDPEAQIHLAGLTWWHDQGYMDRLLDAVVSEPDAAEHDYYFDVLTLHIYFRSETVRQITEAAREKLDARGLTEKRIWINETNAAPARDPEWPVDRPQFPIDLDQQAWYIVQAHALGFAAGAESVGVYKMMDVALPPGAEAFGILRADQSKRLAFEAYKTTIERLSGFTAVAIEQESESHYVVAFEQARGTTHVAWSRTAVPQSIRIAASQPTAELVNSTGTERRTLAAEGGFFVFEVAGAVCLPKECLLGGEPWFLRQEEGAPTPVSVAATAPSNMGETARPSLTPLPPTVTSLAVAPSAVATALATGMPEVAPAPDGRNGGLGLWFVGIGGSLILMLIGLFWYQRRR